MTLVQPRRSFRRAPKSDTAAEAGQVCAALHRPRGEAQLAAAGAPQTFQSCCTCKDSDMVSEFGPSPSKKGSEVRALGFRGVYKGYGM